MLSTQTVLSRLLAAETFWQRCSSETSFHAETFGEDEWVA